MSPIKKIIIKGMFAPDIDTDFFDRVADELEAEYDCRVDVQIIRRKRVTAAHKRKLTRKRVAKWRAKQQS